MAKNYHTKQQDAIRCCVEQKGTAHFTAEDICALLRTRECPIGLSTVYRHLDRMEKEGLLRKYVSSAGESACYQSTDAGCDHFHLRCIVCGRLEHLSCRCLDEISAHVQEEHDFTIDPSRTVFYGLCKECAAK